MSDTYLLQGLYARVRINKANYYYVAVVVVVVLMITGKFMKVEGKRVADVDKYKQRLLTNIASGGAYGERKML